MSRRFADDWVDLTHPLREEQGPMLGQERMEISSLRDPLGQFTLSTVRLVCHHGTHIDAPRHFFKHGYSAERFPIELLTSVGVVWRIPGRPDRPIRVKDIRDLPPARQGDVVLLMTGWGVKYGTEQYWRHPHLVEELGVFLRDMRIAALAVDLPTPDVNRVQRPSPYDWPVHKALLGAAIPIVENVANGALTTGRAEFIVAPLPIVGADGAPVRIMARNTPAEGLPS